MKRVLLALLLLPALVFGEAGKYADKGVPPVMVGDAGAGGEAGSCPAPVAGDAAAGKYLKADGTWAVPPSGTGDITEVNTTAPLTGGGVTGALTLAISDFTGDAGAGGTKGTVPAPIAGDAAAGKYLKADGTWTTPPAGAGDITEVNTTAPLTGGGVTGALTLAISDFGGDAGAGGTKGAVPAPAAGDAAASKFLKADGTWAAPSAGSVAFSGVTSATNTTAAMVVGTGASLGVSGTGTINPVMSAAHSMIWTGRSLISSPSSGQILLQNSGGSDFGRLMFGGTTDSFPALLKYASGIRVIKSSSGSTWNFEAADITGTNIVVSTGGRIASSGASDGVVVQNTGGTSLDALRAGLFIDPRTAASVVITATTSGSLWTNEGATGGVTFTLPAAAAKLTNSFYRQANQTFTITAAAGDTIRVEGSATAAAGSITLDAVGSYVSLVAINATEWVAIQKMGTVTVVP